MKILKYTYLLPLLVLMLFAACSQDGITDPNDITGSGTADVTFSISHTRGILQPTENDNELITSYLIVVTQSGKVVKVLKATSLEAAEMHSVKASLTSGTYKVYAFANIPFSAAGDWLYGKFVEGQPMPDMATMYYGNASYVNGYNGPIPMSNSRDGLTLTVLPNKGTQTYGIEVVRMIAKLEFVFMNSSTEPVKVSQITMGPLTAPAPGMTQGYIPLSWYDDSEALSFFQTSTLKCLQQDYVHTLATPVSLAAGNMGDGKTNVVRFNVIESNPDPITKQFHMSFKVQYGASVEERFALLDKSLVAVGTNLDGDDDQSPFIRRNDWIRIPIDLGDYELRIEARSYPPIGGYPEAETEDQNDEFKVKFKYQGEFSIRPSVRKFGTNDWIYLDDSSVIQDYTLTVDTTSDGLTNIFSKPPTKQGSEILGVIASGAEGTALVTLTINIKVAPGVIRTMSRKLYIII